ncbi:MAG: CDP-alcohol phosphatidyltransferase family protein [Clostridiales bacterium]|nr:CDP-alcohol phosphatidyltransferase family protein [Clostridiales bacterium]
MSQPKDRNASGEDRILTIPNAMSMFRILLIPVIVWLYIGKQQYLYAFLGLLLSGATDLLDGWVARKFHMVSKLGKVLDPIADKLTQVSLLICIMAEHRRVSVLVVLMFIKEFIMAFTGLKVIKKTGEPYSAKWHGKVNTFLLDFTVILHVLWREIPEGLSNALVVVCTGFMIFSLIEYWSQNRKLSRG